MIKYDNYKSVISDGSYETRNMSVPVRHHIRDVDVRQTSTSRAISTVTLLYVNLSRANVTVSVVRLAVRLQTHMACERALVILLVSFCSSWNPRAKAADGEDGWAVNRGCIALLPVLPLVARVA